MNAKIKENSDIFENEKKSLNDKIKENAVIFENNKKILNDKILEIERNYELLSQEKNELTLNYNKDKNERESKISELMEILKEYEHDTNDIGVNTDEYLLNQKLNELFNKEKKKIEDDNIKYEQIEQTKPFQCSICGENFSIETNLKEHMLQHTKILTEEEMDEEKEKAKIIEKEKNNEKEDINMDEKKEIEEEKINENTNNEKENNSNSGLGFFGRLMAPIFLTDTEINKIKGK